MLQHPHKHSHIFLGVFVCLTLLLGGFVIMFKDKPISPRAAFNLGGNQNTPADTVTEKPETDINQKPEAEEGEGETETQTETETETEAIPDYATEEQKFQNPNLPLDQISLPEGFSIEVFATNIPGARSLTQSENGIWYIGSRKAGKVYAIEDRDQNGKVDRFNTIASGLNNPNGVAWKDGDLYVAEIDRVLKFENIDSQRSNPPQPKIISTTYPSDPHHGWKFIRFSPDGELYIPVGAPCNICKSENPIYDTITKLNLETGEPTIIARGIRNTVGFDWHPQIGDLWFTDNGRDWAGDDMPPDELNRLSKTGEHFGYPYCHGNDFVDPEFGSPDACDTYTPPVQELGPHVAALGMRFYTGDSFPDQYKNQIFIAEHGSWNRTTPLGYRVTLVRLDKNTSLGYETFAEGWLDTKGNFWGRPVDLEMDTDGSILVSDDHSGTIYRIQYTKIEQN